MGFSGMPGAGSNAFRMGNNNNSFANGGASSIGGMGLGGRSMPGLGSGVPTPASGLGLGGSANMPTGGLGTARVGNNFGSMQSSYNPSGEILAMINKGQGLGLPPNQPLGMGSALPPALNQPGLQQPQPGLGLGMGASDLVSSMGVPASPSFDLSDFPSLGQRPSASAGGGMQQFRSQPVGVPGALPYGAAIIQPHA